MFKRRLREALNRTEAISRSDLDPLFNNIEAIYLYHDQFFQDIQKNSRNRPKTLSLVKPVEAMVGSRSGNSFLLLKFGIRLE